MMEHPFMSHDHPAESHDNSFVYREDVLAAGGKASKP